MLVQKEKVIQWLGLLSWAVGHELNFCSLFDSLCRCRSIMVSIYLRFPFHKHGVLAFFFNNKQIKNRYAEMHDDGGRGVYSYLG